MHTGHVHRSEVELAIEAETTDADLMKTLREELTLVLAGGPEAQRELKLLHRELIDHSLKQMERTAATIAKARTGAEGQAGLSAFFAQKTSPWVVALPNEWVAYHDA